MHIFLPFSQVYRDYTERKYNFTRRIKSKYACIFNRCVCVSVCAHFFIFHFVLYRGTVVWLRNLLFSNRLYNRCAATVAVVVGVVNKHIRLANTKGEKMKCSQ